MNLPELIADIKRTNREFIAIQEGGIPSSWVDEQGIRHAVVFHESSDRPIVVWDYNLPGTRLAEFMVKGNSVPVHYVPQKTKARYGYTWLGEKKTYGRQFDPFNDIAEGRHTGVDSA